MTKTVTTTTKWIRLVNEWKFIDIDKAITNPNRYRHNDNRKTHTARHNKSVLFRRG
jgi:hypothetical protein